MSQDPGRPKWMDGDGKNGGDATGNPQQTQNYVKTDVSNFSRQSSSSESSLPGTLTTIGVVLGLIGIIWGIIGGWSTTTYYSDLTTETEINWPVIICVGGGIILGLVGQKMGDGD
ncbi:MAG: hypothetical protein KC435_13445 [Thermomicrobiales bacterium]|nr:hypothetical protein [Thermomicrobiales bacterium]